MDLDHESVLIVAHIIKEKNNTKNNNANNKKNDKKRFEENFLFQKINRHFNINTSIELNAHEHIYISLASYVDDSREF